jgi:dTDP-4-amino-4,6-dideoxygalactose transaminase
MRSTVNLDEGGLAILGATPAFPSPVHVGQPNIGDRAALLERIGAILDSRWLTNRGRQLLEFEQRMAGLAGTRHCIAMCNATVALEIVARALELSGEVIMPAMTFVATAHAVQWQGITPVFCDVDPLTHQIDVQHVESLINRHTVAIVGVHLWGRPCNIDALARLAEKHHLKLIFDAAHALGCTYRGSPLGGFGDAEVFSFHATKVANAFEGGAVTTNDDALAEKIRLMQNFGFKGADNVIHLGINGKMHEVSAAMGITSLDSLDFFVEQNRANAAAYREGLGDVPGLHLLEWDARELNNYHYVVFEVDESRAGIDRDTLLAVLHAENVLARRYFWPGCHRMEPYRSLPRYFGLHLPATEKVLSRVLVLPTGTAIDGEGIARICLIVRRAIAQADAVRRHFAPHVRDEATIGRD